MKRGISTTSSCPPRVRMKASVMMRTTLHFVSAILPVHCELIPSCRWHSYALPLVHSQGQTTSTT